MYQMTVDPSTGMIINAINVSGIDVGSGWMSKIDDTHYFVGSYSTGLYTITVTFLS